MGEPDLIQRLPGLPTTNPKVPFREEEGYNRLPRVTNTIREQRDHSMVLHRPIEFTNFFVQMRFEITKNS